MASFEDDDPTNGSGDEFDNEDEEMEDVDDTGADGDADQDGAQDDDEGGDDEDEEEGDDEDEEEDEDQNETESPSRRESRIQHTATDTQPGPDVVLTSPSPHRSPSHSTSTDRMASPTRSTACRPVDSLG